MSGWRRSVLIACASILAGLAVGALVSRFRPQEAARPPAIAAASDLAFALAEIAWHFTEEHGEHVDLVFGSSGTLARQARDGAPFQMFLSADEQFIFGLHEAGLTRDRGMLYAVGRLVLFAPQGSPLVPDEGLEGLTRLLAAGKVSRFAIANPAHAPYGRAAEAALRAHGLWDRIQPALVVGENVSQAAQFAASGDAAGGLIAHSIALAPSMRGRGSFALVPEGDHPPLRQRMVLMKSAGPVAEHFYAYVQTPGARAVLRRYGFAVAE